MIVGKTREETIRLTAVAYGISLMRAEVIYAIEHDEIQGDVVVVDDDGNEIKPRTS